MGRDIFQERLYYIRKKLKSANLRHRVEMKKEEEKNNCVT